MGYFDGLTSSCFKTGQDGQELFFPWGVLGRGYAIGAGQDYEGLRQQIKAFMIVSLVSIIASGSVAGNLASFIIAGVLIALYFAWMMYLLPRLNQTGEKLSLRESMTSQANAHGPIVLWLLEIAAIAFVAGGIFMFVLDPNNRLVALACICFFGLCAAKITRMLWLQRRGTATGT